MKLILPTFICLITAQYCYAADTTDDTVNFKTGLNIGFRTLNFEQKFTQGPLSVGSFSTQPANRSADFSQTFRSIDLSGAVNWSSFYVTANYETNLDAENGVLNTTYVDTTNSISNDQAFDFTRYDYAINFGWNAFDNFSIFTGYKAGETNASRNTPFGTLGVPQGKVDSSFNESGPFVGVSYSWVFQPGVLTFSTAYAYMTGKYDESGDEIVFAQYLPATPPAIHLAAVVQRAMQYEGHTDGFSANLSWNVLINDNYAYYFGARWQKYEFNAKSNLTWVAYDLTAPNSNTPPTGTIVPLNGTADVSNSETITAFYAGVNYLF